MNWARGAGLAAASCALVCAGGVYGFKLGTSRAGVNPASSALPADAPLFAWDGQTVTLGALDAAIRAKVEEAQKRREQSHFEAEFNFYREVKKIAGTVSVGRLVAEKAKASGRSVVEEQATLFKVEATTDDAARALFEASDPSARAKDFDRLKPELRSYIEDVSRREAFEKTVQELMAHKRLKMEISRPRRDRAPIETRGFPEVGASDAPVTVVNFTDFFCEQCAEYNVEMAKLVAAHPAGVRFVFIPYPYSRPDRSMGFARGALCAERQKRYLDYHMAAVALGKAIDKDSALGVAKQAKLNFVEFVDCYKQGSGVAELLAAAQGEANRAGVLQTPVTFVQGRLFEGPGHLAEVDKALKAQ